MSKTAAAILGTVVIVAAIIAVTVLTDARESPDVSTASMEDQIRPALERQLQRRVGGEDTVTVRRVDCVRKSDSDASCIARVAASDGSRASLGITVDIDPDSGDIIWRAQQ